MRENAIKAILLLGGALLIVLLLLLLRPGYLASTSYLTMFIGAELIFAALANYRRIFLLLLISVFLLAGADVSMQPAFLQGRWIVLGFAAAAGLAIYMKQDEHRFGTFHLIALFCVLSSAVSACVSQFPEESGMKAASLLLLFLYCACGARLALPHLHPERFFQKLLLGCEIFAAFTFIAYFVFRFEFLGNPNSLGAVMGVVIVPVLLWGLIGADSSAKRLRIGVEFAAAGLLLMSSFARSGIASAGLATLLLCISLRRYRLLIKIVSLTLVLAMLAVTFAPRSEQGADLDRNLSVSSAYLYKGHNEAGVFGSRRGVWQETWDSIKTNPWFGTGFGTSLISEDMTRMNYAEHHFDSWVVREHGNSYLAIAEWTGLLGMVPFFLLVGMAGLNASRVFRWLRHSNEIFSPAAPAAAIVAAGLFHAMFEDWMFAVGYYLCIFFWVMAFLLVDVLPRTPVVYSPRVWVPMPDYANAPAAGR